jgi:hypothetical protein
MTPRVFQTGTSPRDCDSAFTRSTGDCALVASLNTRP